MNKAASAIRSFAKAHDLLLCHHTNYNRAYHEFAQPKLDTFSWAPDCFDMMARSNNNPTLWIVDDPQSGELKLPFAQASGHSSRVVSFLHGLGIMWGGRLLLMLPNRVEL